MCISNCGAEECFCRNVKYTMYLLNTRPFVWLYKLFLVLMLILLLTSGVCFAWLGVGFAAVILVFLASNASLVGIAFIGLFGPFALIYCGFIFEQAVRREAQLIRDVGADTALWAFLDKKPIGFTIFSKLTLTHAVLAGHDKSGRLLSASFRVLGLPQEIQDMVEPGILTMASRLWSNLVLNVDSLYDGRASFIVSLAAYWYLQRKFSVFLWRRFETFVKVLWIAFIVLWFVKPQHFLFALMQVFRGVVFFSNRERVSVFSLWLKWRLTHLIVKLIAYFESFNASFRKYHSEQLDSSRKTLSAHFRNFVMSAAVYISDLGLPSYVRGGFVPYNKETLEQSMNMMKDLGWPINVNLSDQVREVEGLGSFKEWVLCGSDFQTGIHNLKTFVDHDLDTLRASAVIYKRSEEYANEENELKSLSRYFHSPRYDFPDLALDDVWFIVSDIFKESRLTSFNHIIHMWEKRYALGSFMRSLTRSTSKYSRKHFIRDIGGMAPFKKLWANTFYLASRLVPVAAVSVKGEALPPRKWLKDNVRTVVGSPISQYILSTIWNYGPNHRFAWETTPIKIGMPLNGYWMTRVWADHARCQHHLQGDFTAFDSTVSGKIVEMIAAVRKRGFDHHKDKNRIADLIDINYRQVQDQLLNTTSTGNIYKKGVGLTTGHSSTSMDNSLALVTLYLMAWKEITGLSAREFKFYNQLSCFGDDHILSMLATRPQVWNRKNIASVMSKWGVTNVLEAKNSLNDVTFLSKHGRKATIAEKKEMAEHGIHDVDFVVWHDKQSLLGKLTARVKSLDPSYKVVRLLSYLSLTAHHKDVYDGIVKVLNNSRLMMSNIRNNKLEIPSYGKVLRDWYAKSSPLQRKEFLPDEELAEFENAGKIVQYGNVTSFDAIIGALSMLPDLLSPLLFNFGYMRALQVFLGPAVDWALDFVMITNNINTRAHLASVLDKTPYRVLDPNIRPLGLSGSNKSEMLLRHWLFTGYNFVRPSFSFGGYLNFLFRKMNNLAFCLNGKVNLETKEGSFGLDRTVLIALLSFVTIPDWFPFMLDVQLPDFQAAIDMLTHFILVTIWTSVPPNFREATNTLRKLKDEGAKLAVSAPTGTGKSTSFIMHLYKTVGHSYKKIVVIEPRSLLVHGLVTYMDLTYGPLFSGATTNLKLDESKKVWYVTPQSLFGMLKGWDKNNLYVIDECHLDEPFFLALKTLAFKLKMPFIFLSATMPVSLVEQCDYHIEIPIANVFKVEEDKRKEQVVDSIAGFRHKYMSDIKGIVNKKHPSDRYLVLVPAVSMAEALAEECPHSCEALTAKTGPVDVFDKSVYFATNVADVGLTIPDVTHVITSNVDYVENQYAWKLTEASYKQRRGRTGRTNNGLCILLQYSFPELTIKPESSFTPKVVRDLIYEGFNVADAIALWPESTKLAFAADRVQAMELSDDQFVALVQKFVNNVKPLFMAEAARSISSGQFGQGVSIVGSGAGNISASANQDRADLVTKCTNLISASLEAASSGDPSLLNGMEELAYFNGATGIVLKMSNFLFKLVSDPVGEVSEMFNPNNRDPTGTLRDVANVFSILTSLASISND